MPAEHGVSPTMRGAPHTSSPLWVVCPDNMRGAPHTSTPLRMVSPNTIRGEPTHLMPCGVRVTRWQVPSAMRRTGNAVARCCAHMPAWGLRRGYRGNPDRERRSDVARPRSRMPRWHPTGVGGAITFWNRPAGRLQEVLRGQAVLGRGLCDHDAGRPTPSARKQSAGRSAGHYPAGVVVGLIACVYIGCNESRVLDIGFASSVRFSLSLPLCATYRLGRYLSAAAGPLHTLLCFAAGPLHRFGYSSWAASVTRLGRYIVCWW
jgi:hypothetical protein